MSKEQNKNSVEQTVAEQAEVTPELKESYMPLLHVERKPFLWKGLQKYSYVVEANLRGRKLKIELSPKDMGGYELIDIVFEGAMKLPLGITSTRYKDDFGRTKYSFVYEVRSLDGVLAMPLSPKVKSDGTKLEMLISEEIAVKKAFEKQ